MKKTIRMLGVLITTSLVANAANAAGETGEVNVTQVKVSTSYTQVFFENTANNPDSCANTSSVVVEATHAAKREIYSSAMAALNARLPANFDIDGCSTLTGGPSVPVVTAITVGAQ